jgi:hypothetical protein
VAAYTRSTRTVTYEEWSVPLYGEDGCAHRDLSDAIGDAVRRWEARNPGRSAPDGAVRAVPYDDCIVVRIQYQEKQTEQRARGIVSSRKEETGQVSVPAPLPGEQRNSERLASSLRPEKVPACGTETQQGTRE